jgi:nickel-dependent lactate racemase
MIAKQCSVACGVVTEAPADVLITSAHPLDFDLWQSLKSIANTRWAVRANGPVICLARCPAGLAGMDVPAWPVSPARTRRLVRWLGAETLARAMLRLWPRLAADAGFVVRMGLQTLHRNPVLIFSPALDAEGAKFPGVELHGTVEGVVAAADAMLGRGPQRVTVFPAGGITFPIPPPVK